MRCIPGQVEGWLGGGLPGLEFRAYFFFLLMFWPRLHMRVCAYVQICTCADHCL